MYLAQERAYRALYNHLVAAIRDGRYKLANTYEARAPIGFVDFFSALTSWAVYPIYLGLILVYLIAEYRGWLAVLAVVPKPG